MLKKINGVIKNVSIVKAAAFGLMAAVLINTASAQTVTKPFDELEWVKGADGLYFAESWGDWTKEGDYGMLVKIEAGVELPRHSHTFDYHGMTVQGNWVHSYAKGDEKLLPPGSYAFQAGKEDHGDRCEGTVDCIIMIHQHGPRDFFPET